MPAIRRYAEELRAIGQALDAKGVAGFELYSVPAGYFVKDLREVGFAEIVIVRPSLSPMDSNYMMLRNCPKPDAHDVPIRAAFRGFATRRTFFAP
jgi:hypothetical protein